MEWTFTAVGRGGRKSPSGARDSAFNKLWSAEWEMARRSLCPKFSNGELFPESHKMSKKLCGKIVL